MDRLQGPLRALRRTCLATGIVAATPILARAIGRRLIEAMATAGRELRRDEIVLESSEWRDDAHAFYLGLGFEERSRPARRFRLGL